MSCVLSSCQGTCPGSSRLQPVWSETPNSFPPYADGRLAYCRGADESPRLCLTRHLKNNSVRRRVGEVTYHCEGKPSEEAGLDSELNLREEFRSIQSSVLTSFLITLQFNLLGR